MNCGNNEENFDDDYEDDFDDDTNDSIEKKISASIDNLEKKNIDDKRIKDFDDSKKRATLESVFDERTIFQLNKLLVNGPLDRVEGIISSGKEANVYLAYDLEGYEVAI